MANIYDNRRIWKTVFLAVSLVLVAFFLHISNNLVDDLADQERERMEIWANATKALTSAQSSDIDFYLSIIKNNNNIPVLLVDDNDNILMSRNFKMPEPVDSLTPDLLSDANRAFLAKRLKALKKTNNHIPIKIDGATTQHIYYEDSTLLTSMSYLPRIQIAVMIIFVIIVYLAVMSTKKAEQNKVWVGLSKETAHQLGTPISSLMAWVEILRETYPEDALIPEMDNDVKRLQLIADRFSKIGSTPELRDESLAEVIQNVVGYMERRTSHKVIIETSIDDEQATAMINRQLFEWVIENLCKNAVDAMEGEGRITISVGTSMGRKTIDVADTGKGIRKKDITNVFRPGFTTKKRGWGLGLSLAKRIVEEYHHGRIYVKSSEVGVGTTFRIELA